MILIVFKILDFSESENHPYTIEFFLLMVVIFSLFATVSIHYIGSRYLNEIFIETFFFSNYYICIYLQSLSFI
jgi:hypothetical protein